MNHKSKMNDKCPFCVFQHVGKILLGVLGAVVVITLIAVPTAIYLNGMCKTSCTIFFGSIVLQTHTLGNCTIARSCHKLMFPSQHQAPDFQALIPVSLHSHAL